MSRGEFWRPVVDRIRLPDLLTPVLDLGEGLVEVDDSEDVGFRKRVGFVVMIGGTLVCAISTCVIFASGEVATALSLLALFVLEAAMVLAVFWRSLRLAWGLRVILAGNMLVAFGITAWYGGFIASAANPLWAVVAPLAMGLFVHPREGLAWFGAWAILTALSTVLDGNAGIVEMGGPTGLAMNVIWSVATVFGGMMFFELRRRSTAAALEEQRLRMDLLLRNVLPDAIVERLTDAGPPPPRRFDDVSVCFIDLVGFTPMAAELPPEEVVALLDDLFRDLDALVAKHDLEKIKTIGDAYMVAGGVPEPRAHHLADLVRFALEARDLIACREGLDARVGLHAGPVVAGIIGEKRFAYDLWGDTVNTASRMESSGAPGAVQCTADVAARLEGFRTEPIGTLDVKGLGPTDVCRILGANPA